MIGATRKRRTRRLAIASEGRLAIVELLPSLWWLLMVTRIDKSLLSIGNSSSRHHMLAPPIQLPLVFHTRQRLLLYPLPLATEHHRPFVG